MLVSFIISLILVSKYLIIQQWGWIGGVWKMFTTIFIGSWYLNYIKSQKRITMPIIYKIVLFFFSSCNFSIKMWWQEDQEKLFYTILYLYHCTQRKIFFEIQWKLAGKTPPPLRSLYAKRVTNITISQFKYFILCR